MRPPAPEKAPPLPFHSIEGVGGGAITPMAYLVNPGDECHVFGKPAVGLTYVGLGTEEPHRHHRDRDGLPTRGTRLRGRPAGTWHAAFRHPHGQPGVDLTESDVWLHHFNVRGLLVKENTCLGGLALPAITAGVHFKVNGNIEDINQEVGGGPSCPPSATAATAERTITLTATKTIPPDVLGRPLILTAACGSARRPTWASWGSATTTTRRSRAASSTCPWINVAVAYEFRQKTDPFTGQFPAVIEDEDNWHAFDVGLILNKHTTLVAGYGIFGTLANANADGAWWLQLKHEF